MTKPLFCMISSNSDILKEEFQSVIHINLIEKELRIRSIGINRNILSQEKWYSY